MKSIGLKPWILHKLKEAGARFAKDVPNLYAGINQPGPLYGDDLLPEYPWEAMKKGSAKGINVILGYNGDEGHTFIESNENINA